MPGAPPRGPDGYDLKAVSEWIAANASNLKTSVRVDSKIRKLKERELRLKCNRLALALKKENGEYLLKSEVGPRLRNVSLHQRAVLLRLLETELPPKLANRGEIEIRELLKQAVDTICETFREGCRHWMDAPPQQTPPP